MDSAGGWQEAAILGNMPEPSLGVTRCIYCRAPGLTKEHIYGKWTRKLATGIAAPGNIDPKRRAVHTLLKFPGYQFGVMPRVMNGRTSRPGPMQSQSLKIVCRNCNGGWMKEVTDDAIPALQKLILEDWDSELCHSAAFLSSWIAMVSTNWEFADRTSICIPQSEREALAANRALSSKWQVFLGVMSPKIEGEDPIHHKGLICPPEIAGDDHPLIQITTISLGKMLAVSIYSGVGLNYNISEFCFRMGLVPIHPLINNDVRHPYARHSDPWCMELIEHIAYEIGISIS